MRVGGQPHSPDASNPGKDAVPIVQKAEWAPGPVWMGGKSRSHWDSIPDRLARSQSLYRLSYPAHIKTFIKPNKPHQCYSRRWYFWGFRWPPNYSTRSLWWSHVSLIWYFWFLFVEADKGKFYETNVRTLGEVRNNTYSEISAISLEEIQRVKNNLFRQYTDCIRWRRQNFQHLV